MKSSRVPPKISQKYNHCLLTLLKDWEAVLAGPRLLTSDHLLDKVYKT